MARSGYTKSLSNQKRKTDNELVIQLALIIVPVALMQWWVVVTCTLLHLLEYFLTSIIFSE